MKRENKTEPLLQCFSTPPNVWGVSMSCVKVEDPFFLWTLWSDTSATIAPSTPLLFSHSECLLFPSGSFQSALDAVLLELEKGCQIPPLSGWLDVNAHCLDKARPVVGALEQRDWAQRREEGHQWANGPVAELEGRLACLELSHPNAGSSPMPAQPAAESQLKLPQLFFRAQSTPVLPFTD